MKDKINGLLKNAEGEISVLCHALDEREPRFCYEADRVVSSASTIKVPIMLAAMDFYKYEGLGEKTPVSELTGDSLVFDEPRQSSVAELITWMIVNSDNTATNALIEIMGFDFINSYIKNHLLLNNTALMRKMLDFESRARGADNSTTARDMFFVYKKLFCGEILTPEARAEAIKILRGQRDRRAFSRYIWEEHSVAHKTGGLDYLSHDCGVFSLRGKNVYLGVFIQNAPDISGDPKLIGRVARAVFDEI